MSEPDSVQVAGEGEAGGGGRRRGRVQVLDLITSNFMMLSMLPAQQLQLR